MSRLARAALAGTAALALLTGGGTLAALSDVELVPGNRVGQAGLELQVGSTRSQGPSYVARTDALALLPGGTDSWVQLVTVGGDVPESTLSVSLVDLVGTEDGCRGAEAAADPDCATDAAGDLTTTARVRLTAYRPTNPGSCQSDTAVAVWTRNGEGRALGLGAPAVVNATRTDWRDTPLATAAAAGAQPLRAYTGSTATTLVLRPGDQLCVGAHVSVPVDGADARRDNRLQGDQASFGVRFDLVQR